MKQYLFAALLLLSAGMANAAACTLNANGEITDTSSCTTDTETRVLTIYEIGLCTSQPSGPTVATPFDSSTSCGLLFGNAIGTRVGISSSGSTALTGSVAPTVDLGTYTHLYMFMDVRAGINTSVKFASPRSTDSSAAGNTARETGELCWTKSGDQYNWRPTAWSVTPTNIVCGSSIADQDIAWTLQNSLGPNSAVFSSTVTSSAGTFQVYLTKTDQTLATTSSDSSMGDVARVLVTAPIDISITKNTKNVDLSFKVLDGTNVDQLANGASSYIYDLAGNGAIFIRATASE
ncbi:hypothetical protein N9K66_06610 [Planktomarina temperata]|nr:hypothetical protein [Planktomarina temperata]